MITKCDGDFFILVERSTSFQNISMFCYGTCCPFSNFILLRLVFWKANFYELNMAWLKLHLKIKNNNISLLLHFSIFVVCRICLIPAQLPYLLFIHGLLDITGSRFGSGSVPLRAARSSVEGLNQEIERLVLYPASGTQTPHLDRLRDKVSCSFANTVMLPSATKHSYTQTSYVLLEGLSI